MNIPMKIKKLHPNAILPAYASVGAAGADLHALCNEGSVTVEAGKTVLVHTGVAMAIPEGYVGLVYARSGMASKRGLAPANKVGVVDCDYRGEVMVALHNHSGAEEVVSKGERIAQMVIAPYLKAEFSVVDELSDTVRGEGGFGSTGTK